MPASMAAYSCGRDVVEIPTRAACLLQCGQGVGEGKRLAAEGAWAGREQHAREEPAEEEECRDKGKAGDEVGEGLHAAAEQGVQDALKRGDMRGQAVVARQRVALHRLVMGYRLHLHQIAGDDRDTVVVDNRCMHADVSLCAIARMSHQTTRSRPS